MDQVEEQLLTRLAEPSISVIETLLVLIIDRSIRRMFGKLMVLSAIVVRLAFALRLNYADETATFVWQERRRRLVWSIFILESFMSNGRPDFTLVSVENIHLQLPCHERAFALDDPVKTEPLKPVTGVDYSKKSSTYVLFAYV
jgi:hypothetical protein